jgi:uncharacterized protein YkwD
MRGMVYCLLIISILFIVGCVEQENVQEPITTPSPTLTSTPSPTPPTPTPIQTPIPTITPLQTPVTTPTIMPTPKLITFNFYVKETGVLLNGDVYLNGVFLGKALLGKLSVPIDKLSPGIIVFSGIYNNQPYEFEFNLYRSDLELSTINLEVPVDIINRPIFDTSNLDTSVIEEEIFKLVNEERQKNGVKPLRWNDKIRDIAYTHSEDMAINGYFAHTNKKGEGIEDRLMANKIFFIVPGENLYLIESLDNSFDERKIAETVVEGWLKSPGHRSLVLDLDGLYSDAGVGVYFSGADCYVTMDFVSLEFEDEITLDAQYGVFYYLYDPSYPFDYDTKVSIHVESNYPVDIYIVPNQDQFDRYIKGLVFEKIQQYIGTKKLDKEIEAKKGWGLIIGTTNYKTDISINFDYKI